MQIQTLDLIQIELHVSFFHEVSQHKLTPIVSSVSDYVYIFTLAQAVFNFRFSKNKSQSIAASDT